MGAEPVHYDHLLSLAVGLLGSEQQARAWLSSPAHALGGRTPIEVAATDRGARRVADLLVSLEHGQFS